MYINTGYLHMNCEELLDTEHPLAIGCCGIYRLIQQPQSRTWRPNGRRDYQLLYISSGTAHFTFADGSEQILNAGTMILYRPGEPQNYSYYLEEHPEVCWIHFSGYEAGKLLDEIGFDGCHTLYPGASNDITELFHAIIREMQLQRPFFQEVISLQLQQLFAMTARSCLEASQGNQSALREIEQAVQYFNECFSQPISIEDYAKQLHMSTCWFIRSFRRYMGQAPMQYITSIRINKAKDLLRSTNCSVQEISSLVGYENPLYFSRVFRKQAGCSPTEYRRQ